MKRLLLTGIALVAVAACQPQIPDSAAGVGFDNAVNSPQARSRREAQLAGRAVPPPQAISDETIPEAPRVIAAPLDPGAPLATTATARRQTIATAAPVSAEAEDIARETQAALAAAQVNSGERPLDASPSNPAPEVFSNPGISDENDFSAVGERRSIQADAARREQNKANYTQVAPTAVPKRSGETGPNIVAYALSTTNPKGTRIYNRIGLKSAARYERNCAKYASPDQAQTAFLTRGGPKTDRLGLDPDGDGYACDWDPAPFRKASGG